VWKPADFQLFSAPATPFQQEFGSVYNTLLPYDSPLAGQYVPHAGPYDGELSAGMLAGGYSSQSAFLADAITLNPNGVYLAFMLVPDPGATGASRDFASGPVIPNSRFPIASNVDVWLDGVLVDRTLGADALIPVQARDAAFSGTSHLELLQAVWHPWDDDLTVGPLGSYELRVSLRDIGGAGWDVVAPFKVIPDIPGDFNVDGAVNAADLASWTTGFGTSGSATRQQGDAEGDHDADGFDFLAWQRQVGRGASGTPSAAVPEPASIDVMLAAAALGLVLYRGRDDFRSPARQRPRTCRSSGGPSWNSATY
jgi:hypothetical protein